MGLPSISPLKTFEFQDATFRVYRAKSLYKPDWESQELKDLVEVARQTYQKSYSDSIPLFDELDAKSAVYLVSVDYPLEQHDQIFQLREWLCLRFLPAAGEPADSLDFKLQACYINDAKTSLLDVMIERLPGLGGDYSTARSKIFSQTRLCAIRPYLAVDHDSKTEFAFPKKNKWTGLAFLLMNEQFFSDADMLGIDVQYITCQLHKKVSREIRQVSELSHDQKITFPPAYKVLGFPRKDFIRTDRETHWKYLFSYPGYFLHLEDLVQVFEKLIDEKKITDDVINEYLPQGITWDLVKEEPRFSYFHNFGKLLVTSGKIDDSALTGEELQAEIKKSVRDNIYLRLIKADDFSHNLSQLITDIGHLQKV